jgi:hypothetical protein
MDKFKVLKGGYGIDGQVRAKGDIVTADQIGDTVPSFIEKGIIEKIEDGPVVTPPSAPPIVAPQETQDDGA